MDLAVATRCLIASSKFVSVPSFARWIVLKTDFVNGDISIAGLTGNVLADTGANVAAGRCRHSVIECSQAKELEELCFNVVARLALIQVAHWDSENIHNILELLEE